MKLTHSEGRMSAHTQGPWATRNGRIYQADRETLTIAHIARAVDGDYSETNARLIAAAPDLLEALQLADAMLSGANMNAVTVERKVRAAIAKATGEDK